MSLLLEINELLKQHLIFTYMDGWMIMVGWMDAWMNMVG